MIYLPELYYFFDQSDFPLGKAVLVTAKKVGEWCTHYQAKLISPIKGIKESERQGKLPSPIQEKQKFIDDLFNWIISNSETSDLFALFFDDLEIGQSKDRPAKFDHHDDTCCWVMNLTEQQFQELKTIWKDNGLPEDLFYKEGAEIKIAKPHGLIAKFFIRLGFTIENSKIYSPKRWEEEKRKEFAAKK